MVSKSKQSFGPTPIKVRETDHYKEEYVKDFVEKWDELIDWEMRAKSEGDFFIKCLEENGVRSVLDVACGTGFHSVRLIEAGFEVISSDGSPEMLAKAFGNANKRGHILRTSQADWRWLNRDIHEEFDAIICLGNSFTHLFSERDRRKSLAEFYAALRHDGMLILDHRNYDSIMDYGYSNKHVYYYCGDNIVVNPVYIDEGLARFKYQFPDKSSYYLNMHPLRKDYVRRLMYEVGFQKVETYGDFQETYRMEEPDFFIHVAEKRYETGDEKLTTRGIGYSFTEKVARNYYNSEDADRFYHTIWGGEDIHIGIYQTEEESISNASRRTVERMASLLEEPNKETRILDIGAGYGGAVRYLAKTYGCQLVALNLSEVENQRNRDLNREQRLDHLIDVVDGSFENILYPDDTFDVVWSIDSILHSGDRNKVFEEAVRVLKSGGSFVFTDPMRVDNCPEDVLQPILNRIHLTTMGSPEFYRKTAQSMGMKEDGFYDYTPQLVNHYSKVLKEVERRKDELLKSVSKEYIEDMKEGLQHWIEGGKKGYLVWGVFHFHKK